MKKQFSKIVPYFFAVLLMVFSAIAFAETPPISKFREVSPDLYRGGRPGIAGLIYLTNLEVHTIIDLENDKKAVASEREVAEQLGMQFISKPMSSFSTPDDKEITEVLHILEAPSNYPIFIHCKHGEDRTGLIVGLYRYFDEHWSAENAYAEMKALGFHSTRFLMKRYFNQKVGFHK